MLLHLEYAWIFFFHWEELPGPEMSSGPPVVKKHSLFTIFFMEDLKMDEGLCRTPTANRTAGLGEAASSNP